MDIKVVIKSLSSGFHQFVKGQKYSDTVSKMNNYLPSCH